MSALCSQSLPYSMECAVTMIRGYVPDGEWVEDYSTCPADDSGCEGEIAAVVETVRTTLVFPKWGRFLRPAT